MCKYLILIFVLCDISFFANAREEVASGSNDNSTAYEKYNRLNCKDLSEQLANILHLKINPAQTFGEKKFEDSCVKSLLSLKQLAKEEPFIVNRYIAYLRGKNNEPVLSMQEAFLVPNSDNGEDGIRPYNLYLNLASPASKDFIKCYMKAMQDEPYRSCTAKTCSKKNGKNSWNGPCEFSEI